MRKITVSIGYYDFTFQSLKDAEDFADTAARASEKDCTVRPTYQKSVVSHVASRPLPAAGSLDPHRSASLRSDALS